MAEHRVTEDVLKNLIMDMAAEFIASRSGGGGVGEYVCRRYPYMDLAERAAKEKQVIGRIELAQNVKALAGEIAEQFGERIVELGIPHFYHHAAPK